mgnify:CR=1 FL=1
MTAENKHWIQENTLMLVSCSFVFFTILMQILHWCKINVFKVVVMLGTFALAMAFAGNDLVNFIGVPLAGFSAYTDFMANGNGEPMGYLMNSLNGPAKTPFLFLFLAGVIMVYALITSKKAQNVVKTSVDLSRQDEGDEMFGSSAVARSIVRSTMSASENIAKILPDNLKRWADSRFNKDVMIMENGAAFDLIRASVNLVLAGLLIALGTSLKLPLSTTYVTFMVAMGSSLADRAGAVTVPYIVSPVCFLLSVDGSLLPELLSLSVLWLRSSCIMEAHSPCWLLLHLPSSYWYAATYTTARNRRIKAKTTYSPASLPVKTKKSVGHYFASM